MIKAGADKLALVAYAASRTKTPFELGGENGEFEIWGCNMLYGQPDMAGPGKWYDRWFEAHSADFLKLESPAHWTWLQQCQIPVIMYEDYKDEIPTALRFPIEESIECFGDYFTSTIAYMMASALMECLDWATPEQVAETGMPFVQKKEGAKEIYLYGIHMASDEEYHQQRACVEYYMGIARGAGIKVFVPEESSLLKTAKRYGKHQGFDIYRLLEADIHSFENAGARELALAEAHQKQATMNAGAVKGIRMCMKKWFWDHEKKGIKSEEGQVGAKAALMDEDMCQALADAVNETHLIQSDTGPLRNEGKVILTGLDISKALVNLEQEDIGVLGVRIWQNMSWEDMAGHTGLPVEQVKEKTLAAWQNLHNVLGLEAGDIESITEKTDAGDGEEMVEPDNGDAKRVSGS